MSMLPSLTIDGAAASTDTGIPVFFRLFSGRGVRFRTFSASLEVVGQRFRGHWALIVGLGGLLAIMAIAGIAALRVLQNVRAKDETIRSQFLARNHLLHDIRTE